jgi:hypothetical protein
LHDPRLDDGRLQHGRFDDARLAWRGLVLARSSRRPGPSRGGGLCGLAEVTNRCSSSRQGIPRLGGFRSPHSTAVSATPPSPFPRALTQHHSHIVTVAATATPTSTPNRLTKLVNKTLARHIPSPPPHCPDGPRRGSSSSIPRPPKRPALDSMQCWVRMLIV